MKEVTQQTWNYISMVDLCISMVMDDIVHWLVHQYGDDVATETNHSHPKVPQTADGGMTLHVGGTNTYTSSVHT